MLKRVRFLTDFADVPKIAAGIGRIKGVKAVYLFGSRANGKSGSLSDIDMCIIGSLNEKDRLKAMGHASDNLDISFFSDLPLIIKFRVLKEGKSLFCRDELFMKELKRAVFLAYLDYSVFANHFYKRVLWYV